MVSFSISSENTLNVEDIAQELVNRVINMGVLFIEADPKGCFVYKNPFNDDIRIEMKSVESRRSSRKDSKLSKEFEQPKWEKEEIEDEKTNGMKRTSLKSYKRRTTLHSRLTKYTIASQDSDISMTSKKYSYIMVDPINRASIQSTTSSKRSTFENIFFREKRRQSDQEELWNYAMSESSTSSDESEDRTNISKNVIASLKVMIYDWQIIDNFDITTTVNTIRDFVSLWKLSPTTEFAILRDAPITEGSLGNTYHVTVAFSKPTKMCPNPLTVANVYFDIYYSFVMPPNYPVMITYRFETYRTNYRLMGKKNMRSITFQNYFIETIFNAKLSFYAQMFEATNGPLNQTAKKFSVEKEYEMFNKHHEFILKLTSPSNKKSLHTTEVDINENGDTRLADRNGLTLLLVSKDRKFSRLIEKDEPWKLGYTDAATVEKINLKIKLDAKYQEEAQIDVVRNSTELSTIFSHE